MNDMNQSTLSSNKPSSSVNNQANKTNSLFINNIYNNNNNKFQKQLKGNTKNEIKTVSKVEEKDENKNSNLNKTNLGHDSIQINRHDKKQNIQNSQENNIINVINNRTNTFSIIMNSVTYKSIIFIPLNFLLLALTLVPIQYHNENFGIQMKKMQDSCAESLGYFNENQTYILDTLFPYGFSSALSFEHLYNELKLIDEIHKKQSINNITIKYLSQSECLSKNYTNIINMITISSVSKPISQSVSAKPLSNTHKKYQIKQQVYYQLPSSNVILVCDDDAYKKSLINSYKSSSSALAFENQFINGISAIDLLDFQTNVIAQWNISCKNLSTSTVTISYAQMTFLSGKIIGAIFFSMLADYVGRKKVYLGTLYVSAVIGSLISMVKTYRQFVIIRFPIAALAQGCFVLSYVLLFEFILKFRHRNIYCTLFISSQFIFNIIIALMTRAINDWRYMQLIGSLFASIGIIYPWLIKESFKWLIVKDYFDKAERVCNKIFKESGIIARLVKLRSKDQVSSEEFDTSSGYWPMIIWQPTFRKIISYFVFMWSILSLINFFINEETIKLASTNINNYIYQNLLIGLSNICLALIYFKCGKRFPLGSCMFLGGAFYLASSLINQDMNVDLLKTIFYFFSKVLVSCSLNILMLYVCELFPCEIRCSSFSFFLSIKHLSEMFAIYVFKVNLLPMTMIKIGLSIFCILLCICSFLLPERSAFSFNLDYLEYLNRNQQFVNNSSVINKNVTHRHKRARDSGIDSMIVNEDLESQHLNNRFSTRLSVAMDKDKQISSSTDHGKCLDNVQSKLITNNLINKLNSESHSKSGKLNPLYEEDQLVLSVSTIGMDKRSNLSSSSVKISDDNSFSSQQKVNLIEVSSTKF